MEPPVDYWCKLIVDLILSRYLIVEKKLDPKSAYPIITDWLSECDKVEALTFNPRIPQEIRSGRRSEAKYRI